MKHLLAFAIVMIAFVAVTRAETDPCASNPYSHEISKQALRQDQQVAYLHQRWKLEPRSLKTALAVQKYEKQWRRASGCKRSLVEDRTRRFGDDLVAKLKAKQAFVRWSESEPGRQKIAYDTKGGDGKLPAVSAKPPKATEPD